MCKKLLIGAVILTISIFSFSYCFAENGFQDAADGVRDVVGGAENAVEDAAKDVSNASKDATGDMESDANNQMATGTTSNGNYTATRTATNTGNPTLMGMDATAWTWLIIGIVGIAIVALVWYYSSQFNSSKNYDDGE